MIQTFPNYVIDQKPSTHNARDRRHLCVGSSARPCVVAALATLPTDDLALCSPLKRAADPLDPMPPSPSPNGWRTKPVVAKLGDDNWDNTSGVHGAKRFNTPLAGDQIAWVCEVKHQRSRKMAAWVLCIMRKPHVQLMLAVSTTRMQFGVDLLCTSNSCSEFRVTIRYLPSSMDVARTAATRRGKSWRASRRTSCGAEKSTSHCAQSTRRVASREITRVLEP